VGSADILQKLGFDMDYTGSTPEDFLAKNNFVFMFAPRYHPSLKGIGKVRREIKVPTIFNYAGPLLNPAEPEFQVIGINKRENLDLAANAARICGRSGITFYSSFDGYDEVSSNGFTECLSVEGDHIDRFVIDPSKYFTPFEMPAVDSLETAEHLLVSGLSGADEQIAKIFAINTALALKTMKENDLEAGYSRALSHILSGAPMTKLKAMTGVV
jgi:anthranilate phosphoribosyltransferase